MRYSKANDKFSYCEVSGRRDIVVLTIDIFLPQKPNLALYLTTLPKSSLFFVKTDIECDSFNLLE